MNGDGEGLTADAYYGDGPEDIEGKHDGERPAGVAKGRGNASGATARQPADAVHRTLAAQSRRIGRSEAALAANTVVNQLERSFPDATANPLVKAGLQVAPLLLLQPANRGVEDPRVLAGAAVAGLALAGEITTRTRQVESIRITPSMAPLGVGGSFRLVDEPRDGSGRLVGGQAVTWESSDTNIATVDGDGVVTANAAGDVRITATVTVDGKPLTDFALVTVA